MKNKFLLALLALLIQTTSVYADSQVKVAAMSEFKTTEPTQQMSVRVVEDSELDGYKLKSGDIINCTVVDVDAPKRGKRNAVFYVQANSITATNGSSTTLDKCYIGKYSKTVISPKELKNVNYGKVAKKAALTVGNHFVKGISTGVAFVEGVAENNEDNRLKSGLKNAYEESPLSYAGKGVELDIKPDETFYFVFKDTETSADKPNYTYSESE